MLPAAESVAGDDALEAMVINGGIQSASKLSHCKAHAQLNMMDAATQRSIAHEDDARDFLAERLGR